MKLTLILFLFTLPAWACPELTGHFKRCSVFGDVENFPKMSEVTIQQEMTDDHITYAFDYMMDGKKIEETFKTTGHPFHHGASITASKCRSGTLWVSHLSEAAEGYVRTAVFEYVRIGTQELRFMADIADLGYVAVSCR